MSDLEYFLLSLASGAIIFGWLAFVILAAEAMPARPQWLHEVKYDSYRLVVVREDIDHRARHRAASEDYADP